MAEDSLQFVVHKRSSKQSHLTVKADYFNQLAALYECIIIS